MSRNQVLLLCISSLLANLQLIAATPSKESYQLDLDTEISWIFFDRISSQDLSSQIDETSTTGETTNDTQRAFGLEKAEISLSLVHHSQTKLTLGLRPDALLHRQTANGAENDRASYQKIDRRAGASYRPNPAINLLDTYQLALIPSQNFQLSLGVFNHLEPEDQRSYGLLEFGLNVRLPEKVSAMQITWSTQDLKATPNIRPIRSQYYTFDLYAFQGREDRSELIAANENSFDSGPSAQDPFLGGALSFSIHFEQPWTLLLHYGYLDTKVVDGKRNENFFDTRISYQFNLLDHPSRLFYQAKWSRERWNLSTGRFPELEQRSHRLNLEHGLSPKLRLFWSLSAGHSDQLDTTNDPVNPEKIGFDGQQIEIGLVSEIYPQLYIESSLAAELRDKRSDGRTTGGFERSDGNERSLNRFAIRLQYQLNSN